MRTTAPRLIIATIALVSLAGLASPVEAAAPAPQARNVWCC